MKCNYHERTRHSFDGLVNSGEAGGHRSKPEVLLALHWYLMI